MRTRIREVREKKGMSQSELARRTGLSRQRIWALESGEHINVTTKTLETIAKALGKSVKELLIFSD